MGEKIKIHETAMVTCSFRAMDETLSGDCYAHLWHSDTIMVHADRYSTAVSSHEPHAHCLRNRYFLDTLNHMSNSGKLQLLINFGCGFSMYPFLLPPSIKHLEIDLPEVIKFKKKRIDSWMHSGTLPKRQIKYMPGDFNRENNALFLRTLKNMVGDSSTFILLEGVLFFLSKEDTGRLFALFSELQRPGDLLGSVSFQPQLEEQPVFRKLVSFVEGNLNKNEQFTYQTVADTFYESLDKYRLIDHQNTIQLNQHYCPDRHLEQEEVLNEHMYLLERT